MGVKIDILSSAAPRQGRISSADVIIRGRGMRGLKKPEKPLYLGNSGTTMRILPGILAGQDFSVVLKGDRSLSKRPMKRIVEPLRKMGSEITGTTPNHSLCSGTGHGLKARGSRGKEIYPPLQIHGGNLKAIKYKSKIASAQVKSCILLAGLFAKGVTSVTEPVKSRDNTERMLKIFGCTPYHSLRASNGSGTGHGVGLRGPFKLKSPGTVEIPGDISSAAFFIVAGSILPRMKIVIKKVGLNPTRTGILDILKRMGADIRVQGEGRKVNGFEPSGNIIVKSSKLKGVTISPAEVARAIDEMPVIMVAACVAKGITVIKGISELRVKETDRIKSMVTNLRKVGADIRVEGEGWRVKGEAVVINGGRQLHGARVSSFGDHRTAMSMLIAGLVSKGKVTVRGLECINKSLPGFQKLLRNLN